MSAALYAVGTSILYGRTGVCQIEDISPAPDHRRDGQRYYKLRAVFSTSGERIYIPVDAAVSMRPLIGGGEASDYLERFPRLKPQAFASRKPADLIAHYQDVLASCQPENCLLLLKEIYLKGKELTARNKKLGQVDSRYLKIAERLVCEEFAVALQTAPDSIRKRLYAAMDQEAAKAADRSKTRPMEAGGIS